MNKDKLGYETLGDMFKREIQKQIERIRKGKWGRWELTADRKALKFCPTADFQGLSYEIPLSRIESEGALEWFAHLREKSLLFQRGDIEDLISCFDDLFGVPWIYDGFKHKGRKKGK